MQSLIPAHNAQVWVSEAGGLEKVDEAVRRGRMIKCKACNRKGATLGCHIRSCRHSFHMVCARATKCRLHVRSPSAQFCRTCQ